MKGGYDVVPANIMLAGAEQDLSQTGKEHRLKEAVSTVAGNYDFVVIDTPPSLGALTVQLSEYISAPIYLDLHPGGCSGRGGPVQQS